MTNVQSLFRGRKLVIATMHGKEQVLAPVLQEALGVDLILPASFNTDAFGTFSGEIPRELSPDAAAIAKCSLAMQLTGCDLAVASEGSFGPHPILGFVPTNEEWLFLVDRKHNLQISAKEVSTATNFDAKICFNIDELISFADKVQFPSHALMLMPAQDDYRDIVKGITNLTALKTAAESFLSAHGQVFAATDMRAMYNSSRMKVIAAAAQKLIDKIFCACPECGMPGFEVKEVLSGLPCSACSFPTRSSLAWVYICSHCGHRKKDVYPHEKTTEDPMYCDRCNP